jgi:hypothetical protein
MSIFSKKKPQEPQNIDEILAQFKELKEQFAKLSLEMEKLKKEELINLKKVGVVRFNPFSEMGSNQSFSAAIMDSENNGLVITSLFTRSENRVYGKPLKNGGSEYPLTDEEKEAIKKAQGQK